MVNQNQHIIFLYCNKYYVYIFELWTNLVNNCTTDNEMSKDNDLLPLELGSFNFWNHLRDCLNKTILTFPFSNLIG